jgi:hypothetical protein
VCKEAGIKTTNTEKNSPWQNRTEVEIRELKKHIRRFMHRTNSPLCLWDFCTKYTIELRNRIARPLPQLHGRTPYEVITGNTPDISEFLEFTWYQPVWYYESTTFPAQTKHLARLLGVAHKVGQAMCYWLLPVSAIPIARTTIQEVSQHELQSEDFQRQLTHFDNAVHEKLQQEHHGMSSQLKLYRQDENEDDQFEQEPMEPDSSPLDIDEIEADAYDELLLTEPLLPNDGVMVRAKIIGRKRDIIDNPVGTFNVNPLLNTRVYLAEFPDGHIQELSANIIAEAIYSSMSDDGCEEQIFHDFIDHRQLYDDPDNLHQFTTKGWEICVAWTDGTSSWHKMVEIKNSFPLALAEYAIANELQNYRAFCWWVPHTLRKRKHAIKAVKSRYSRRTHKFGIYVPQNVQEALEVDRQTNTTFGGTRYKRK